MTGGNTRYVALSTLNDILFRGKKPRELLDGLPETLDRRDRAFIQEIIYGVLRNLYFLDWCLKPYLRRPEGLKDSTLNNLRIGAYQILLMRVSDWAAVSETVEVEKKTGRNTALTNAVLRRLLRDRSCPPLPDEEVKRLSISTSHPEWLVRRWLKRFGAPEGEKLLRKNNERPNLTLRVNLLRKSREEIASILDSRNIRYRFTELSSSGIVIEPNHVFPEIADLIGDVYVQDEAAQLVTSLLHPGPGQRILDACSAPGGKTTYIAELTGDMAEIIAMDISPERASLMRGNIERLGFKSIRVVISDSTLMNAGSMFDRILLDAPCSSMGVIRRNPDVRYRHHPSDLKRFHEKQLDLLLKVSPHLRRGGVILYTVCSTEPEEGPDVVNKFLHKRKDFFIIDIGYIETPAVKTGLKGFRTEDGFFLSLPHRDDMDGFFAAVLSLH
ncbi:ribosomal RNA small subunit methyltransferase B [bacterium BMS3Bbin06]|nr:ribosomal RNA small subunit methyltransferase B [bacterium BMS3Abin08]GBE34896.1 ribosomal RNA small subunit methyltransferase B [bacterium BMS3Bbin06]HDO36368.1 16S rRNA (cytosine(967)-C(5))-methyltransferase RsmB [Nitrospirota bacterium]